MTPDELQGITSDVEKVASDINAKLTKKIADDVLYRFEKHGEIIISESNKFTIKTLQRSGKVYDEIMQEIGSEIGKLNSATKGAFLKSVNMMPKPKRVKTVESVKESLSKEPEPPVKPVNKKVKGVENLTGTTAKRMKRQYSSLKDLSDKEREIFDDMYKRTRNEFYNLSPKTARNGQKMYIEACNEAYLNAMAGMSPQKAVNEALKGIAKKGMYVEYASGRKDTIEVAVTRAVRTAVNQAHARATLERASNEGEDLVLVSSHLGARPSHQVWQGKIYSISGESKKYPNLKEKTGYGTAKGLCGINCRHTFTIYYPNASRNNYAKYTAKKNEKQYNLEQTQRKMEREIRKTKRQRNIFEEIVNTTKDEKMKKEANEQAIIYRRKLREQNAAYTAFCNENNLKRYTARTRVAKLDK